MNDRSKHNSGHLAAMLGELAPTQLQGEGGSQGEATLQVAPNRGWGCYNVWQTCKLSASPATLREPSLFFIYFISLLQLSYKGSTGTVIIVHATDVKNYQQSIRLTRRHRWGRWEANETGKETWTFQHYCLLAFALYWVWDLLGFNVSVHNDTQSNDTQTNETV
jgi:hypothetical protein